MLAYLFGFKCLSGLNTFAQYEKEKIPFSFNHPCIRHNGGTAISSQLSYYTRSFDFFILRYFLFG